MTVAASVALGSSRVAVRPFALIRILSLATELKRTSDFFGCATLSIVAAMRATSSSDAWDGAPCWHAWAWMKKEVFACGHGVFSLTWYLWEEAQWATPQ